MIQDPSICGWNDMCLGIPMRVAECDGVMVHVGYAVRKMSEAEASSTWDLFDEMLAAEDAMRGNA
jgi:hydrogenase maturation factor